MLELEGVNCRVTGLETPLVEGVTLDLPRGHHVAIVGPSGCGKSTLLRVVAGLAETSEGSIRWDGRDLAGEGDFEPWEIGYVPQFGIVYEHLTVRESVESSFRLRVRDRGGRERRERVAGVLSRVGLEGLEDRMVKVLSGGQRRRLALALELVSSPSVLLCDEVTSGLDPKSEREITQLLHDLSREGERLVVHVTHALRHLALFDSVVVMHGGRVVYHGTPDYLLHYFGVEHPEEIFPLLARREAESWRGSWEKHRAAYYHFSFRRADAPPSAGDAGGVREGAAAARGRLPSPPAQMVVLLGRRMRIFLRDRGQLGLHLALIFGFPCMVVIFALQGLPEIWNLNMGLDVDFIQQLREASAFLQQFMEVGTLVSGLVMFQVILLALMGANNSAREIVGERLIFEKEKLAGLSVSAYVASKVAFLGLLVMVQAVWMGAFVDGICRFPGDLGTQVWLVLLVNAAMTSLCLAISAFTRTPEQASLLSVYLVGFQLPLSGAILAPPEFLAHLTRPAISAYWGWAGCLHSMRETRLYDAAQMVSQSPIAAVPLCVWVLCCHVMIGIAFAWFGARRGRWD